MSRFDVSFADLHNPLFMNGNLGTKLNPKSRPQLKLQYDTDLSCLIVEHQGTVCLIPSSNVASATAADPASLGIVGKSPMRTLPPNPEPIRAPIIVPTAPAPAIAPNAMAPQVPPPQPRTAQVSNPTRDVPKKNGPKLTGAPKFRPHSESEIQNSARIQASGEIKAGAPAPTKADLEASGKLPTGPKVEE